MSPSPLDPACSAATVEELLRDLGPRLRRGGFPLEPPARLPTGISDIDRLLGGGFPRGRLSEIAGPASSGRTSLATALLARTTQAGEAVAVIDGADAFDPASAHAAGARLDRVLWVRAPHGAEALRSTEQILKAHGFAIVLLDLTPPRPSTPPKPPKHMAPAVPPRLARAAASTGTALVVLTQERVLGSAAEVALELEPAQTDFTGAPTLLEGLAIRASLVRQRAAPRSRCGSGQGQCYLVA